MIITNFKLLDPDWIYSFPKMYAQSNISLKDELFALIILQGLIKSLRSIQAGQKY